MSKKCKLTLLLCCSLLPGVVLGLVYLKSNLEFRQQSDMMLADIEQLRRANQTLQWRLHDGETILACSDGSVADSPEIVENLITEFAILVNDETAQRQLIHERIFNRLAVKPSDYVAAQLLKRYFVKEIEPQLVADLAESLDLISEPKATAATIDLISAVVSHYPSMGEQALIDIVYFSSISPEVRTAAIASLKELPNSNAPSILNNALFDEDMAVRQQTIQVIDYGEYPVLPSTVDRLLQIAEYDYLDMAERIAALSALSNLQLSQAQQKNLEQILAD